MCRKVWHGPEDTGDQGGSSLRGQLVIQESAEVFKFLFRFVAQGTACREGVGAQEELSPCPVTSLGVGARAGAGHRAAE